MEPRSPAFQEDSLPAEPQNGKLTKNDWVICAHDMENLSETLVFRGRKGCTGSLCQGARNSQPQVKEQQWKGGEVTEEYWLKQAFKHSLKGCINPRMEQEATRTELLV